MQWVKGLNNSEKFGKILKSYLLGRYLSRNGKKIMWNLAEMLNLGAHLWVGESRPDICGKGRSSRAPGRCQVSTVYSVQTGSPPLPIQNVNFSFINKGKSLASSTVGFIRAYSVKLLTGIVCKIFIKKGGE